MLSRWLTPQNVPSGTRDILLVVPDDPDFEAIIRGALVELLTPENYEESSGGLTPEETVEIMRPAILDTMNWVTP